MMIFERNRCLRGTGRHCLSLVLCLFLLSGCSTTPDKPPASSSLPATTDEPASPTSDVVVAAAGNTEPRETIAILWGRFRTQIALPDPEQAIALADATTSTTSGTDTAAARPVIDDQIDEATGADAIPVAIADETDIWARIRAGFAMSDKQPRRVRLEADWYSRHQAYFDRTIERARPYLHLIVSAIDERDMPMEIALLPIVESAFQPFAYSHGRAAGIWQFIPGTAKRFGLKQNWWYDGRRDILASTTAALDYLQQLNREFKGDWELALAAYNSGSGTVRKAIRKNKRRQKATDFWHLQLPRETRAYVPKLLALRAIVNDPASFGIRLASIPDEPYLATVDIDSQIDLALAAELSGLSLEEIYRLNPAFNHWATDPDGPHRLLLPIEKVESFKLALAELPSSQRIRWQRHRIRPGETLGHIARRYRTTVKVLTRVNKIPGHMIRAGRNLIIPVATRDIRQYTLSAEQRLNRIKARSPGGKQKKKITHRVRNGDTFWDIARKYGTTVRKLARWNGLSPRDILKPGQKLVIWRSASSKTAVKSSLDVNPLRQNTTRRIRYTVRKGDSLARISQRFRVRISELRHWNDLPKGRYLQPGQRLTLYVDVTRQTENI